MPKPTFLHLPVLPFPDSVIDNDIAANPDLPADPCIITIDDSGSESVRPEENDGEGPARPIVPIGAAASSGSGIPHGTLADTLPGTASRASCGASCGDTDIDTDSDGMDSTHVAAAASGARAASETAAASGAAVAAVASDSAHEDADAVRARRLRLTSSSSSTSS